MSEGAWRASFRSVSIYFISTICLTTACAVLAAYLIYDNYFVFKQQLTTIAWTVLGLVLGAWLTAVVGGAFFLSKALNHMLTPAKEAVGYSELTATMVIILLLLFTTVVLGGTGISIANAYVNSQTVVSYLAGITSIAGLALILLVIGMAIVLRKKKDPEDEDEDETPAPAPAPSPVPAPRRRPPPPAPAPAPRRRPPPPPPPAPSPSGPQMTGGLRPGRRYRYLS